jgi:hypothetical protein
VVTEIDEQKLEGEIFIKDILVNGKPRPATTEVRLLAVALLAVALLAFAGIVGLRKRNAGVNR